MGFKLNLKGKSVTHYGISDIQKPNLEPGIVGIAPLPWLQTPLNLEPKSTVLGNIAFGTYIYPSGQKDGEAKNDERANGELKDLVEMAIDLEVTDFLSATIVRFSPSVGYPRPAHWPVPDATFRTIEG